MSTAGPLTAHRPERVAVVIPAKNEAERIEATIGAARTIQGVDLVVVVDDGSSDATSAVAMGADALVVRHKTNRGKAAAMATGAQMVEIREDAERADGGESFSEELHAEPRSPGHTGPLPVIDGHDAIPRALLFLDADMEASAIAAQPLVDAVLGEGVDMAIALLPRQAGAGGMGIVVGTARRGIQRATGWDATQPLSGTRCITRETWDACQPLAAGWGVETSLTIDALTGGFWVKEIEADLQHRATGRNLSGQLHRAAQLRDVVRALARRRHVLPEEPLDEFERVEATPEQQAVRELDGDVVEAPIAPEVEVPAPDEQDASDDHTPEYDQALECDQAPAEPETSEPAVEPSTADTPDAAPTRPVTPAEPRDDDSAQDRADRRRDRLAALPVAGAFSDDETRALGDLDAEALGRRLRDLPVDGLFAPDDAVYLAGVDLEALAARLHDAPVQGPFSPEHAVIIASHLAVPEPELPSSIRPPLNPDEYTSLVVHAAVDAGNVPHADDDA
ncbi:glycosyltransferase [Brachybacterium sp. FME24]|uniref:glycosyltransferase n=1 Tax=Brachybacterium sp. FME24 TaxID=2742605 RepID=UPI0018678153|nr:glycosyltransferase [Brachybacterium sp. FME24]